METIPAIALEPETQILHFAPATTGDVLAAAGPPLSWVVPGYVGEGLTVLAGCQKLGNLAGNRRAIDAPVIRCNLGNFRNLPENIQKKQAVAARGEVTSDQGAM